MFYSSKVINRCNLLNQRTVDAPSINIFKSRLCYIRDGTQRFAVLIGNAQYWYFRFFYTFLDIYFSKCNVYLLGRGQAPSPDPTSFVMTQINEMKRNTLQNSIYAYPMSTANLHSSQFKHIFTQCCKYFILFYWLTVRHQDSSAPVPNCPETTDMTFQS